MSFISTNYYIFLIILAFIIAKINFDKKYLLLLLFNCLFSYLFGIETVLFLLVVIVYTYFSSKLIISNKIKAPLLIIPIVLLLVGFRVIDYTKRIIMPIGMSFYSLQAISYLIEVGKDNDKYENDFLVFATAVSFFPTITSGPIERLYNLIPQLRSNFKYDSDKAKDGLQLIVEGLFKKMVIANRIIDYINSVYIYPEKYGGLTILFAIFLYSIQIYCDFSAYSDIAVGSAKMIGINLTNNFNNPYFSKSIKEFWRRWHISLSTWLKDYVYIPLGGNRISKTRTVINTMLTFIVSGLWHGLGISYIIWGVIHGLLNSINIKIKNKFVATIVTIVLISFSWVFFRANDVRVAYEIFKGLFTRFSLSFASISEAVVLFKGDVYSIPYSLITLLMILLLILKEYLCEYRKNSYKEDLFLFIYVLCIVLFGTNGINSFIYQGF